MAETMTEVASIFQVAAELATDALAHNTDRSQPVVHRLEPKELKTALKLGLPRQGQGLAGALDLAKKSLHYSVHTGHPRFMNQLFGGQSPAGILGEWITALTNTSMYTYEAAPVGTLVELAVLRRLNDYVGFKHGEGVLAPGGSISNLMAVLAARHAHFPHIKESGLQAGERPVIFTSEAAHYSIARAAMVCGLGMNACIKVATDSKGRMIPAELERLILEAKAAGQTPFFVNATVGTTVHCAFDPVTAIADITERHGLWLHADGSYGGSALISDKHRHLLQDIQRADSMTWTPHKMMGAPLACSAMLTRKAGVLENTFASHADYLFHEDADENLDLGDRSLQCGRRVDALKLWFMWQAQGAEGFAERVDGLFATAERFRALVREREGFRIMQEENGTNVCFRYLPRDQRHLKSSERDRCETQATVRIRQEMLDEGSFLINYATVGGGSTFRFVASNPEVTTDDLRALLARIERS
ncbi:MAG: sulfinoalanine decarboxylase [Candidatus Paceibacteria bacterium]|jgi:sulfinoalanine decarboxylase